MQPGTQIALENIAALFDIENRRVGMEEPGYDAAVEAFKRQECTVVPIPVSGTEKAMLSALESSHATCYFCTPSNQFPLGYITPIATRLKVIDWARKSGAYIIEDDYCCEYRYDGLSQAPSLQSLAPERVIYMGTLSKILSPAIRVSFLVLPPKLLKLWTQRNSSSFCPLPWSTQRCLELFLAESNWDVYTKATVKAYQNVHDLLMGAIRQHLGNRVDVLGEQAGLHILLGDGLHRDQEQLIELARAQSVRVYGTHQYWRARHHAFAHYVLVGFSSIDPELIDEGVKRLGRAWYGTSQPM